MEKAKGRIGRSRNLSTFLTACASRERMRRTCGWPLPEPETWPYEFLARTNTLARSTRSTQGPGYHLKSAPNTSCTL